MKDSILQLVSFLLHTFISTLEIVSRTILYLEPTMGDPGVESPTTHSTHESPCPGPNLGLPSLGVGRTLERFGLGDPVSTRGWYGSHLL